MKALLPRTLVTLTLAASALGVTGCVVAPVGPPVAVGVYARPAYGYYGPRPYYGPRYYGYYGRRW